jgi:hypothetical protein
MSGVLPIVPAPTGRGLAGTLVALVGGVAVYMGAAAALRSPEMRSLLGMLRRGGGTLPGPGRG